LPCLAPFSKIAAARWRYRVVSVGFDHPVMVQMVIFLRCEKSSTAISIFSKRAKGHFLGVVPVLAQSGLSTRPLTMTAFGYMQIFQPVWFYVRFWG
jgi:hypothetical protein